jgi:phospholipid-binding lipoprotein MlaA
MMSVVCIGLGVVALAGCGTIAHRADDVSLSAGPPVAVVLVDAARDVPAPSDGVSPAQALPPDEPVAAPYASPAAGEREADATVVAVDAGAPRHADPSALQDGMDGGAAPVLVSDPEAPSAAADRDARPALVAQAQRGAERDEYDIEEYDPWEPFNERMFEVNRNLDRYVLKPAAQAYDRVVPDDVQRMVSNAFDNLGAVKRMVNSLLQAKWDGAAREMSRFLVNTTVGVGGLFDMGRAAGIEKSNEDFGQTLGVYGAGPGPYLILPLFEPMTVRDGIGKGVDSVLDPLTWMVSLGILERVAMKATDVVNERSLNLELFQGFEETVIDMYSAVRHAYLERRRNLIKQ